MQCLHKKHTLISAKKGDFVLFQTAIVPNLFTVQMGELSRFVSQLEKTA